MMAKKAEVVPLFRRGAVTDDEPEIEVGLPPVLAPAEPAAASTAEAIDLSGRPKVRFLIGAGGGGKTTLARWIGWRLAQQGGKDILAALDPQNRTLASWFNGVEQPPTSDAVQTARWLRDLLKFAIEEKVGATLDFGGGDTALARMVETAPGFATVMEDAGVAPVAIYMLAPRTEDLASLETLEAAGFRPKATAIVLNEGRVDSTLSRDEAFVRIIRHGAFRRAVARGGVPIWMPRLEPEVAQEVEGKRLHFGQARDGLVPESKTFAPIGGFERAMVGRWLERMEQAFDPIKTWLL
jgi:hypothetical protein